MKRRTKVAGLLLAAVLLVVGAVFGTMAYLTSTDTVTNTFTVGKVKIELDEAEINDEGKPIDKDGNIVTDLDKAERVDGNEYHLLPGHEYTKDPTVTVLAGSELSYVRLLVTITKSKELDGIKAFEKVSGTDHADLTKIFTGYDPEIWECKDVREDTDSNTRTYEFWYTGAVSGKENGSDEDNPLPALFTGFTVPGGVTNDDLAELEDLDPNDGIDDSFEITVVAHAIQADGFDDADGAWAAFGGQHS